jgi:hypothetical protein
MRLDVCLFWIAVGALVWAGLYLAAWEMMR